MNVRRFARARPRTAVTALSVVCGIAFIGMIAPRTLELEEISCALDDRCYPPSPQIDWFIKPFMERAVAFVTVAGGALILVGAGARRLFWLPFVLPVILTEMALTPLYGFGGSFPGSIDALARGLPGVHVQHPFWMSSSAHWFATGAVLLFAPAALASWLAKPPSVTEHRGDFISLLLVLAASVGIGLITLTAFAPFRGVWLPPGSLNSRTQVIGLFAAVFAFGALFDPRLGRRRWMLFAFTLFASGWMIDIVDWFSYGYFSVDLAAIPRLMPFIAVCFLGSMWRPLGRRLTRGAIVRHPARVPAARSSWWFVSPARTRRVAHPLMAAMLLLLVLVSLPLSASPGDQPSFLILRQHRDGRPITWDTCEPIRYRVYLEHAPDHARALIAEAVRRTERVTRIDFRYHGATRMSPVRAWMLGGEPNSSKHWPTVVIGWVPRERYFHAFEEPSDQPSIGVGGSIARRGWYRWGYVAMKADKGLAPRFAVGDWGPVVQHEIGHVLGLDHPPGHTQLMSIGAGKTAVNWRAGDREGLRELGRSGPCTVGR